MGIRGIIVAIFETIEERQSGRKVAIIQNERLYLEERQRIAELAAKEREREFWDNLVITRPVQVEGSDKVYFLAGSVGHGLTETHIQYNQYGEPHEVQVPAAQVLIDPERGAMIDLRTGQAILDTRLTRPEQVRRLLEAGGWPRKNGGDEPKKPPSGQPELPSGASWLPPHPQVNDE